MEKNTNDSKILSIVKSYSRDFVETPYQPRTPIRAKLNKVTEKLVLQEVNEMLEKGAIRETIHCKAQFVSHLFLVSKKDGGEQPVINLKDLNTFIPYKHFKVEGLHILKEILFWTLSSPKLFTKLIKVPVSILHKLYIRILVYLDDFLIPRKTFEETILSRDTVIYVLQNLGFVIKFKKSVLHPTQKI